MISIDKKYFLDTNILVYANDTADLHKQHIAKEIILTGIRDENLCLSTQVLSEFYVTVTQKIALPFPHKTAQRQIELLGMLQVVEIDYNCVLEALNLAQHDHLSYWDAQIIAAAAKASCDVLLTEDLNNGQVIHNITITNPFAQN